MCSHIDSVFLRKYCLRRYNLDEEDDRWLNSYNEGQNRLSADKLEFMLHYLEVNPREEKNQSLPWLMNRGIDLLRG